jgi:hypothetical protein
MAFTSIAPIKQALVHYLRSNDELRTLVSSKGFHEGFAPPKSEYPFVTYQVHYAPIAYTWTSATHELGFDVFGWSENSVEADNLDQLLFTLLHDAELQVEGQSTLICRRLSSLSLPGKDDEGKKIYQAGGIYEVWTDQPLPTTQAAALTATAVLRRAGSGSFTVDAELV